MKICTKVKFRTENDAAFHIQKMRRTSKVKKNGGYARPYYCQNCSNWHITSQEPHKDQWISRLQKKNTAYKSIIKEQNALLKKKIDEITELKYKLNNITR